MSAMRIHTEPIGFVQRVAQPPWKLEEHLLELATRYGIRTNMRRRAEQPRGFGTRPFGEPEAPARRPCRPQGPYVAVEPIRELIRPLVDEIGAATVAALAGLHYRAVNRLMNDQKQKLVTWQMADYLICDALDDPSLWHSTPGLELRTQSGKVIES